LTFFKKYQKGSNLSTGGYLFVHKKKTKDEKRKGSNEGKRDRTTKIAGGKG